MNDLSTDFNISGWTIFGDANVSLAVANATALLKLKNDLSFIIINYNNDWGTLNIIYNYNNKSSIVEFKRVSENRVEIYGQENLLEVLVPTFGPYPPVPPAGSAIWGAITGTISSQTDLQTALNLKANLAGATFTGAVSATNLSGTNTGDETRTTIKTKLATSYGEIIADGSAGVIVSGVTTIATNPTGSALTTLTTANTWYKLAGTTSLGNTNGDFDMPANNQVRYIGSITKTFLISTNFICSFSSSATPYAFMIYKNGNQLVKTYTEQQIQTGGSNININFMESLAQNDFLELYAASNSASAPTVRLKRLNLSLREL
jgi:hypothetical protein